MEQMKKTVMLVDDDIDYLNLMRMQLEAANYRVVTAENPTEAEGLLKKDEPDIAIVDLMMENMDDGFVLCHRIKRRNPSIPVIMVTAVSSETGIEFDAKTQGERSWLKADAVLTKPARFEQLKREIERLVGEIAK